MRFEVMIIESANGATRRHYVTAGYEISLCGFPVTRRPGPQDRYVKLCERCSAAIDAYYRKGN